MLRCRRSPPPNFRLRSLSPPSENAHDFARIGTGDEATPIFNVGKPSRMQVVDGVGDPGGATDQQDAHLLLVGRKGVDVERQNQRQRAI